MKTFHSKLLWLIRHTFPKAFLLPYGLVCIALAFVDHRLGEGVVRIFGYLLQDHCLNIKKSSIAVRTISVLDFLVGVLVCRSTAPQLQLSDCLLTCVHSK